MSLLVGQRVCPGCGVRASQIPASSYSAEWKDKKKEFLAEIEITDAADLDPVTRANLPQFIADRSWCSCGCTLTLGDFKLTNKGSKLRFVGSFYCSKCNSRPKSLGRLVVSAISKIKRFKLGTDGIEVEK